MVYILEQLTPKIMYSPECSVKHKVEKWLGR